MTPNRAVYRHVYAQAQSLMDTYDTLPDAEARYPFVYVESGINREQVNSDLIGHVSLTVHWFGVRTDVPEIDKSIGKLHDLLQIHTEFGGYALRVTQWSDSKLPNPTDAPEVSHYIADIEIMYNKKG